MTRAEAIKVLEMFLYKQCDLNRTEFAYDANTVWNAVKMAIEALKAEPCEDCISFESVKNTMFMVQRTAFISDNEFNRTMDLLMRLPSVTPQHTDAEIQKMQEMEQAEIQKAYELGKAEMQLSEDCISRQAAIDAFNAVADEYPDIHEAIEIVLRLPFVTPQPCNDAISRQAVLDAFWKLNVELRPSAIDAITNMIKDLSPVTPAKKVGRWILRDDINGQYQCEECGMFTGLDRFDVKEGGFELPNYCPNCGSKMEDTNG